MAVTDDSTTTDDTATPGEAELEPMDPPGEGLVEDPVKANSADPVIQRGDLTVEQQEAQLPPEGAVWLGAGTWAMPGSAVVAPAAQPEIELAEYEPTMGVMVDGSPGNLSESESGKFVLPADVNALPPAPPQEVDEDGNPMLRDERDVDTVDGPSLVAPGGDTGGVSNVPAASQETAEETDQAKASTKTPSTEAGQVTGTFTLDEQPSTEALPDIDNMTVAEVKAYVEANPDQTQDVYDAEMKGKQRSTLLDWLEQEDSAG